VYLKLAGTDADWQDRAHFYAVAARVMRHILIDHARKRDRQKRSGGATHIPLDEAVAIGQDTPPQLLDLDRALNKLAARDERKSRVVELLFFGGLTYEESAAVLNISAATLHRELKMAKAWLYSELEALPPEQSRHDAAV
jgi:RNA polymerase sigma factor (TIGR02999 family)